MTVQDIPTGAQLAWAGRVWDSMQHRDREACCRTAFGYVPTMVSDFGWASQGAANQLDITRGLLRLEELLVKAHR
jgi:hypothetical protein